MIESDTTLDTRLGYGRAQPEQDVKNISLTPGTHSLQVFTIINEGNASITLIDGTIVHPMTARQLRWIGGKWEV